MHDLIIEMISTNCNDDDYADGDDDDYYDNDIAAAAAATGAAGHENGDNDIAAADHGNGYDLCSYHIVINRSLWIEKPC